MAKISELPSATLDLKNDTIIVLPKSGKTIVVSKSVSGRIIAQIDSLLKYHTNISFSPNLQVKPNAICPSCPLHPVYAWVLQNGYRLMPQKNMGIYPILSVESPQTCHRYGFNIIWITASDPGSFLANVALANAAGFYNNQIGVVLPSTEPTDVQHDIDIIQCGTTVGYYLIDEPIESNAYRGNAVNIIVNKIAPKICKNTNSPLVLTSYTPTTSTCAGRAPTGGTLRDQIAQYFPGRIQVYCDQYYGNCCGTAGTFWSDYFSFYGWLINPTNFMDVRINNSSYYYYTQCWPNYRTSGFGDLFTNYINNNQNTAMLYAGSGGDTTDVLAFLNMAFQEQWVQEYELELEIDYANTDCTCDWQGDQQGWILYDQFYIASRWVNWPNY